MKLTYPVLALVTTLLFASSSRDIPETHPPAGLCLTRFIAPQYPPVARGGLEGDVRVKFKIDANGKWTDVEILGGHPMLQQFVEDAIQGWRFCSGGSEARETVVTFAFRLEGDRTDYWTPTRVEFGPDSTVRVVTNPARPVTDWVKKKK